VLHSKPRSLKRVLQLAKECRKGHISGRPALILGALRLSQVLEITVLAFPQILTDWCT